MKASNKTILEYISAISVQMPDVVALIYNESEMTYKELDQMSNRLANYLVSKGVGSESVIGVCIDRSFELLISVLGIIKSGAAYLHIDKTHPADRIQYVLTAANATWIIAQSSSSLELLDKNIRRIDLDLLTELKTQPNTTPQINIYAYNLINVIFTSGSTGKPKGVGVHHYGFLNRLLWMQKTFPLAIGDRVLQKTPLSFDVSGWELFWPLMFGATIVIPPQDSHKDPYELIDIIEKNNVTLVQFVPTMLQTFISCLNGKKLPSLKTMIAGGEALTSSLYYEVQDSLGIYVHNLYGPTEATIDVTSFSNDIEVTGATAPIGRAIDNTAIYLLDKNLEPVQEGEVGEVYIVGVGLARGYSSRPDLTAGIFIANPFRATDSLDTLRMYKTGDLAKTVANGNIEYLGRVDSQVKIKGFRIELEEIQNVLNSHASVANAIILAKDNERSIKQLIAYVEIKSDATNDQLLDWCRKYLPEYMVPSQIVFMESIPLTTNGKVDKEKLLEIKLDVESNIIIHPQTTSEIKLLKIWQGVLKQKNISVTDNFFRIGGDSIIAIQVVTKAKKVGINCNVDKIFRYPTIRELSHNIQDFIPDTIPVEDGVLVGRVGLIPIQKWFFNLNLREPSYFSQTQLFMCRDIDIHHLQCAWHLILSHHDSLRITYHKEENNWVQLYQSHVAYHIEEIDFSNIDSKELPKTIDEYSESKRKQLEPAAAPVNLSLIRCSDGVDRLLIVIHHLIMDGVSWRILVEDLDEAYHQSVNNLERKLLAKTHSFRQWHDQINAFAKNISCAELKYWKSVEENISNIIPWNKCESLSELSVKRISLNSNETELLLNQVSKVYNTHINDVLLLALTLTIGDIYGKYSASFVLEGHGREDIIGLDVTRTIGWFTSIFPVNLTVTSPNDVLKSIYEIKRQLSLIPNKGIGYGLIQQDKLRLIPQILFNYLGKWDSDRNNSNFNFNNEWISNDGFKSESEAVCLLNINCSIFNGKFEAFVSYSRAHFNPDTIDVLSDSYISNLRKIIQHSQLSNSILYNPGYFTNTKISNEQLVMAINNVNDVEAAYPLTPLQEGFLFYKLYNPQSSVYYVQNVIEISGELSTDDLKKAWNNIAQKHDALRTAFLWDKLSQPIQYVLKRVNIPFIYVDIRGSDNPAIHLKTIIDEDRAQSIDLHQAPLMRVYLIRLSENSYVMIWGVHHIITDGWSSTNILKAVFEEYEGVLTKANDINIPVTSYKEYIACLQQQDHLKVRLYWKEYLGDINSISKIFHNVALENKLEKGVIKTNIPSELLSQSMAFARIHGLTLNSVFFGALGLVVSKYARAEDVFLGMTMSGRSHEIHDIDKMTGLFINTLPIKIVLHNESILCYMQKIQNDIRAADQNSSISLAEIQSMSGFSNGLFEVIYMHENYPMDFNANNDYFSITGHKVIEQNEYPLGFVVVPGDIYHIRVSYNTSLISFEVVNNFTQHFINALAYCIQNESCNISDLEIFSNGELDFLTSGSKNNKIHNCHGTIVSIINKQAHRSLQYPAIWYNGESLSYEQLHIKTNRIANEIKKRLSSDNRLVGLYLDNPVEVIIGMIAVLKAGKAYLPIDYKLPKERVNLILQDSSANFIISHQQLFCSLSNDKINIIDLNSSYERDNDLNIYFEFDDLAYVIYTSGSTGTPKGVMVTHDNLYNYTLGLHDKLSTKGRVNSLLVSSLSADLGYTSIIAALTTGGCLFLCNDEQKLDGKVIAELINANSIDLLKITPSHYKALCDSGNIIIPYKYLVFGGEVLDKNILELLRTYKPSCRIFNHYGPTETTIGCCAIEVDYNQNYANNAPIGTPLGDNQAYILDNELNLMPIGVPGHLYIAGNGLSRGYINSPSQTAKSFIANPFVKAKAGTTSDKLRLYNTGDIAKVLRDGSIEYIEREDTQVKIRGYRVELAEITNIVRGNVNALDAHTIAIKNKSDAIELICFVVLKNTTLGRQEQEQELKKYMVERLPSYMLPDSIVPLANIPLNANGKVDIAKLNILCSELKSKIIESSGNPKSATEITLHNLWCDLLGVEYVSVNDSFFNIGGHSLLAIKLINRISKTFNTNVKIRAIFDHPTINELAKHIDDNVTSSDTKQDVLIAQDRSGAIPLSFAQQRLWIMYQLSPEVALYNMPSCFKMIDNINKETLEKAINAIFARHEILRSNVMELDGKPYQQSKPTKQFSLNKNTVILPDSEVNNYIKSIVNTPIDIYKDELMQIKYIETTDSGDYVLFNLHHIIADGWSLLVLFNEISTLYNAYVSENITFSLPNLNIDYFDYAIFEKDLLVPKTQQLEFWKKSLHELPLTCTIPNDFERPVDLSYMANKTHFDIGGFEYKQLSLLSKCNNMTKFMLMAAILQTAIYKYTGQEDVVIGIPVSNRDIQNCENIIGLFVNTIPLVFKFDMSDSFNTVLARTKGNVLSSLNNKDISFDSIVDSLNIPRLTSTHPIFQIMLVYTKASEIPILSLQGITSIRIENQYNIAKYDMVLSVIDYEDMLSIEITYSSELYTENTMKYFVNFLCKLIGIVLNDPNAIIDEISIIENDEYHFLTGQEKDV